MRRLAIILALASLIGIVQAAPALAEDLGRYLERAEEAEYSGEMFVVCDTPDGTVGQFLRVTRTGGELWVRSAGGEAVAGEGELYHRASDGTVQASRVDGTGGWELASRYATVEAGSARELERPVQVVTIVEGDIERVRLHFDQETGALLRSEVRNGDRSLYCTSSFVSFSERPAAVDSSVKSAAAETLEVFDLGDVDEDILPSNISGFRRLDVYVGPEDSVAAYYSDGVFSFTVIAARQAVKIPELDEAPTVEVDGGEYQRLFRAGEVVYAWESKRGGYALIGDLPLDLQEAVLSGFPRPGRPGFFVRLWRSWFG